MNIDAGKNRDITDKKLGVSGDAVVYISNFRQKNIYEMSSLLDER